MTDAIDSAIAQAEARVKEAQNLPATQPSGQAGVPAQAPTRAPALKMTDVIGKGLMPDFWVKVNEFGITVGDDRTLRESITVNIDLRKCVPCLVVKFGNPATYLKSFDGVTCVQGGTWVDAQRRAQSVDSRSREYRSVDVPMTLAEDLKKGKEVVVPEGAYLGHSTATTNWRNWENFYTAAMEKGLHESVVRVKLGFQPMKNKNGNEWGVLTFELLGSADEFAEAA